MRGVWLAALAFAGLVLAGVAAVPLDTAPALQRAKIIFIGSSITAGAIPFDGDPGGILGDARPHAVLAKPGTTEAESSELLRSMLHHPVEHVFVEIAPYVQTLAAVSEDGGISWKAGFGGVADHSWALFGERLRDKAGWLFGRRPTGLWGQLYEQAFINDRVYDGNHNDFPALYPLTMHAPLRPAELDSVLSEAKRKGVRVTFFMTPRSEEAADFLGAAANAEAQRIYRDFSHRFGVDVWQPDIAWANEDFLDSAHLNVRGRARFVEALQARFGPH